MYMEEVKSEEKCLCEGAETLLFSCSGGSNVGQITNQAAIELTGMGKGRMYCLAGIGAHGTTFIETAKAADRLVAIDGCPVQCAKKTLEHAGFDVNVAVTVTDLEIGKKTGFSMEQDDINKVIDAVSARIN